MESVRAKEEVIFSLGGNKDECGVEVRCRGVEGRRRAAQVWFGLRIDSQNVSSRSDGVGSS